MEIRSDLLWLIFFVIVALVAGGIVIRAYILSLVYKYRVWKSVRHMRHKLRNIRY